MSLLEINMLSVQIGAVPVLHDVSLNVRAGEIVWRHRGKRQWQINDCIVGNAIVAAQL